MVELKKCPCCGSRNNMIQDVYYAVEWRVLCLTCGLQTKVFRTKVEAATAWNRRA